MKKIKLYNIVILIAIAFAISSCKKLVDIPDPIDTATEYKIFKTDEQANQTIAGLYSQMIGVQTSTFSYGFSSIHGGLAADELVPTDEVSFPEHFRIFKNQILADSDSNLGDIWTSAYQTIYTANAILDGENASISTTLTINKRNELKGTAKFVRAFSFFYLTGFYGEVPLTKTSKYKDNIKLGKSTKNEIYNSIITDLEEAMVHFSNANLPLTKAKANQYSAEALLARVYLYNKNWEKAKLHADNVIKSNRFSLSTLATTFNKNSSEAIFQLVKNPIIAAMMPETDFFSPLFPLYTLSAQERDSYMDPTMYEMLAPFFVPKLKLNMQLVNAFEPGDNRISVWANNNGSPSVAPYNGEKTYFANKYPIDFSKNDSYTVLRLGEMYLIRAEAFAQLNELDLAMDDVDKIRGRAGLLASTVSGQPDVLVAVAKERQTELFAEWGHRFFDLKRTGKAVEVLSNVPEKSGIDLNKLDFPIPSMEITKNPRLKQNPGY